MLNTCNKQDFALANSILRKPSTTHALIVKKLIRLVYLKFGLNQNSTRQKKMDALEHEIQTDIDAISSLDEDYILALFFGH